MISDEKLMHQYIEGDYMAFEALYERHKGRVYSYLYKRIHNKDMVGDLFQEIFFKLHRSQKSYDPKKPFVNWLYIICKTQTLDFLRKRKITEVELKDFMLEHQNVEPGSIDLYQYQQLSLKEREAIDMRFNKDQDYHEISKILNTTQINSRKIVSRALAKIKESILRGGFDG